MQKGDIDLLTIEEGDNILDEEENVDDLYEQQNNQQEEEKE